MNSFFIARSVSSSLCHSRWSTIPADKNRARLTVLPGSPGASREVEDHPFLVEVLPRPTDHPGEMAAHRKTEASIEPDRHLVLRPHGEKDDLEPRPSQGEAPLQENGSDPLTAMVTMDEHPEFSHMGLFGRSAGARATDLAEPHDMTGPFGGHDDCRAVLRLVEDRFQCLHHLLPGRTLEEHRRPDRRARGTLVVP